MHCIACHSRAMLCIQLDRHAASERLVHDLPLPADLTLRLQTPGRCGSARPGLESQSQIAAWYRQGAETAQTDDSEAGQALTCQASLQCDRCVRVRTHWELSTYVKIRVLSTQGRTSVFSVASGHGAGRSRCGEEATQCSSASAASPARAHAVSCTAHNPRCARSARSVLKSLCVRFTGDRGQHLFACSNFAFETPCLDRHRDAPCASLTRERVQHDASRPCAPTARWRRTCMRRGQGRRRSKLRVQRRRAAKGRARAWSPRMQTCEAVLQGAMGAGRAPCSCQTGVGQSRARPGLTRRSRSAACSRHHMLSRRCSSAWLGRCARTGRRTTAV